MPAMRRPNAKGIAVTALAVSVAALLAASAGGEDLSGTFYIRGTYVESEGHVEIHFADRSGNTTSVILEVLGMPESFQRTYHTHEFTELVPFREPPQYGWKTNPITLVVQHSEHGTVRLKTEIHSAGEPVPPVIIGR